VFVEVADVTSKVEQPLEEWLATHPVEVRQVAHVMVPTEQGKQSAAPWQCSDPNCPRNGATELMVSVSSLPSDSVTPISLQLTFSGDDGSSVSTVTTGNQTPAVVKPAAPPGSSTVIVTPYYLFAPKDQSVKDLMGCKERLSQK
jgi:hypothetical protein